MGTMNKVVLCGRLGKDPAKMSDGENSPTVFSLATHDGKDKEGKETSNWHRIVVFGKSADLCQKYLKKGDPVLVEGRLQYRTFEGSDQQKITVSEVVVNNVVLLPSKLNDRPTVETEPPVETKPSRTEDATDAELGGELPF